MLVTLGCQIQSYQQMKDRGFKIVLETGELDASQVLGLHDLYNKQAWAAIGENPVRFEDIKDDLPKALESTPKERKSKSQKLRAVLFLLGQQRGEKDPDKFYDKMMDEIINFYKSKLDK